MNQKMMLNDIYSRSTKCSRHGLLTAKTAGKTFSLFVELNDEANVVISRDSEICLTAKMLDSGLCYI